MPIQRLATSAIDIDATMAANSNMRVASQKATKAYADTKMAASAIDTDTTMAANSEARVPFRKRPRRMLIRRCLG